MSHPSNNRGIQIVSPKSNERFPKASKMDGGSGQNPWDDNGRECARRQTKNGCFAQPIDKRGKQTCLHKKHSDHSRSCWNSRFHKEARCTKPRKDIQEKQTIISVQGENLGSIGRNRNPRQRKQHDQNQTCLRHRE